MAENEKLYGFQSDVVDVISDFGYYFAYADHQVNVIGKGEGEVEKRLASPEFNVIAWTIVVYVLSELISEILKHGGELGISKIRESMPDWLSITNADEEDQTNLSLNELEDVDENEIKSTAKELFDTINDMDGEIEESSYDLEIRLTNIFMEYGLTERAASKAAKRVNLLLHKRLD